MYILDIKEEEKFHMSQVYEIWIWHIRMGHLSFDNLIKSSRMGDVKEISKIIKPSYPICKHCQLRSKQESDSRQKSILHQNPWRLFTLISMGPLGLEAYKGNTT